MILTEPGIYGLEDLGDDVNNYHADPTPGRRSLNATLVNKKLLNGCPKLAWFAHPGLNPDYVPAKATNRMDEGTVAHLTLTGKGRGFRVIEAEDYRTKASQVERDAYREAGLVPILRPAYDAIVEMITALRAVLPEIEGGTPFNAAYGEMEACALAYDAHGCWLRSLIDFYGYGIPDGVTCWDYKTVSGSANPHVITAHATSNGWAIQAAFQDRILTALKPHLSGKISYKFLVQETDPPYLVSVVTPSPGTFSMAQAQIEIAVRQWALCLREDKWPTYPLTAIDFGLLPSVEAAWTARLMDAPVPVHAPSAELAPAQPKRRALRHARPKDRISVMPDEDVSL